MKKRHTYHEAAHAVVAVLLGVPFEKVSMVPRTQLLRTLDGYQKATLIGLIFSDAVADSHNDRMWQGWLPLAFAIVGMAGHKAEEIVLGCVDGETARNAAAHHSAILNTCCLAVASEPSVMQRGIIEALEAQATAILHRHWAAVDAVANALNERKVLTCEDVTKIIAHTTAG